MTNREIYDVIDTVFATVDREDKNDVLAWVEKQRAALDRKNEKAKERAANKRTEGDALRGRIEGLLTETPMTINEILMSLDEDDLTPAKISSRMTQLIKAGKASKEKVKVDGRTLMGYTIASYVEAEAE